MSVVLFPADAVAGAPSYTGEMLRQALAADLGGATSARPLGARSGVRPGTSTTATVTITGTGPYTVNINPHGGILDLETSAIAGPYRYSVNTTQSFSLTAQGGSARTDVVWLQLNDPGEGDGSATPAVVPGYTANTSSVPNSRCLLLATLNVPATGTAPTVTWAAPFSHAAGGVQPALTLATARNGNYDGELMQAQDTHNLYMWLAATSSWVMIADPTSWTTYTPSWVGETSGTGSVGAGATTGRYKVLANKTITGTFTLLLGTGAGGPSGVYNWTIPTPLVGALQLGANVDVPCGSAVFYGGAHVVGTTVLRGNSGGLRLAVEFQGQTGPATSGNPGTWGVGSRMSAEYTLELA